MRRIRAPRPPVVLDVVTVPVGEVIQVTPPGPLTGSRMGFGAVPPVAPGGAAGVSETDRPGARSATKRLPAKTGGAVVVNVAVEPKFPGPTNVPVVPVPPPVVVPTVVGKP